MTDPLGAMAFPAALTGLPCCGFSPTHLFCRSRKKPRERRFELRNILISRCLNARLLTFYEVIFFHNHGEKSYTCGMMAAYFVVIG
jgi:hypothetical protein